MKRARKAQAKNAVQTADPAEGSGASESKRSEEQNAAAGLNKYGTSLSEEQKAAGFHRRRVGGGWAKIGKMQLDFLVAQGLRPESRLLDIGCGALRGGIHFISYLEPAHYFGTDVNESLLDAGLRYEVPDAGLSDKLPAANLRTTDTFECDFGVRFDFALAVSVFTHLPLNHLRVCLAQLAKATDPGAKFYVTFFEAPEDTPIEAGVQQPRVTSKPDRDPYHYRPSELDWAATVGGWQFRYIGDWQHPRGQRMAEYTRV